MAVNPISFPQYQINSQMDFTPLAKLGDVYRESQNRQKLSDLGKGLASGTIDYRTAAGQTADMGDINSTLKFLALQQEQNKLASGQQSSSDFHQGVFGVPGAAGVAPKVGVPTPAGIVQGDDEPPGSVSQDPAALPPPAVPVPSSPTVMGTVEGQNSGLYETPKPPVAPPVAPAGAPQVPIVPTPPANAVPRPSAMGEGGPTMAHMPYVVRALGNPNLPEGDKYVAQTMFKHILDNAKPNERIQFLEDMKEKSKFPGTLLDLELALRKSGAMSIDASQKQETTAASEGAKALTKRFADYSKAGEQSAQNLSYLDMLKDLRGQFDTGGPAAAQAWLAGHGIKVGKNVSKVEAYNSIIEKMTPWQRPPGSGATSDAEQVMYRSGLPRIINSPGGNDVIDATTRAEYEHNQEMGRISDLALAGPSQGGITHGEALKRMRALPSPYGAASLYIKNGFKPIDPAAIEAEIARRKAQAPPAR